ncbi:MAG: nucleoside monophosphate kinase [Candidatus Pacebacteria bacterium]|nr:nucleoside monophosphate kinase [Candidatus Paceibacterota bacterium]
MNQKLLFLSDTPFLFIFTGQSGAGKDTQLKLLQSFVSQYSTRRQIVYSSGDYFRALSESGSYTARLMQEKNNRGELTSSHISTMFFGQFLEKNFNNEEIIFFNGAPRFQKEAAQLDEAVRFYNLPAYVAHIKIDNELAFDRLMKDASRRERPETKTAENIRRKLAWYLPEVVPAIEYLRSSDRFMVRDFEGDTRVDMLHNQIVNSFCTATAVH